MAAIGEACPFGSGDGCGAHENRFVEVPSKSHPKAAMFLLSVEALEFSDQTGGKWSEVDGLLVGFNGGNALKSR